MPDLINPKQDARRVLLVWVAMLLTVIAFNVVGPMIGLSKMTVVLVSVGGIVFAIIYTYIQKGVEIVL